MNPKTEVEGIFVSGRHLGPNQFRGTNIEKSFSACEDGVTIRLDDISIPEWWQEIHITKDTLKRMLNEVENSKEEA